MLDFLIGILFPKGDQCELEDFILRTFLERASLLPSYLKRWVGSNKPKMVRISEKNQLGTVQVYSVLIRGQTFRRKTPFWSLEELMHPL